MITDEKVEGAMRYLAETDEDYANAKGDTERFDILRKRTRMRAFLAHDGTVAERNAEAEIDGDVEAADSAYVNAVIKYETYRAKRQRAELVVEVWRTIQSNRRAGM